MIKEACVENFTHVPEVIQRGADRIELCDNLAEGGTTPSYGVMKMTAEYCHVRDIPLLAIIRPRGGDFVYSEMEKEIMLQDLEAAAQTGVDGVVIGALLENGELDTEFLEECVGIAQAVQLDLTFHRAFDRMPADKQEAALPWLAEHGFSRVLTHGGPDEQTIVENIPRLRELMAVREDIVIMPGGGVTWENLPILERELDLREAHGTKIV